MLQALFDPAAASSPAAVWFAALADVALKGLVVVLCAAAAAFASGRASAATRHLIWSLAVGGLLALPVLSLVVPEWRVPLLPGTLAVGRGGSAAPAVPAASARVAVAPDLAAAVEAPETGAPFLPGVAVAAPLAGDGAAGTQGALSGEGRRERWHWAEAALLAWLAGAALVLLSIVAGLVRVRRLAAGARPCTSGPGAELAARIGARLGVRQRVTVLEGEECAMPMTWGILRPVVFLPAGTEGWPEARLEAVLLHELAHVRRRDYLTQLAAEVACALYWFNPLVWVAARRLRDEREHACDDQVLNAGSRASDYASELLDMARSLRTARVTSLAAMALARPSHLTGRLLAVLDENRSRAALSRRLAVPAWIAAAALVLPLAAMRPAGRTPEPAGSPPADAPAGGVPSSPALAADPADCWDSEARQINIHSDGDGVQTIKWSNRRCSAEIRLEGEVEFTDDFTGIARVSRGGLLRIEEEEGWTERKLEVRPGPDGRPGYAWSIDGKPRDFDAEAQAWLSGILLQLVRQTGWGADQRVDQLLRKGGPGAVLAEVGEIRGDYVQRLYLGKLLEKGSLDAPALEGLIRQAGRELDSDFELAELLIATSGRSELTDDLRQAFIEATRSISSDFEQRRVLSAALKKGPLNGRNVSALLHAAQELDSDFELAELLIGVAKEYRFDAPMRDAYLEAANTISSDFEQRRVFSTLLRQPGLSPENLAAVLSAARELRSDFELAELLIQTSELDLTKPVLHQAFLQAASTIDSDFEHRRVLSRLLGRQKVGPEALAVILESALTIGSDFELAELLVQIARSYQLTGPLREAYLKAADTIGSQFEHGRVASALIRQGA